MKCMLRLPFTPSLSPSVSTWMFNASVRWHVFFSSVLWSLTRMEFCCHGNHGREIKTPPLRDDKHGPRDVGFEKMCWQRTCIVALQKTILFCVCAREYLLNEKWNLHFFMSMFTVITTTDCNHCRPVITADTNGVRPDHVGYFIFFPSLHNGPFFCSSSSSKDIIRGHRIIILKYDKVTLGVVRGPCGSRVTTIVAGSASNGWWPSSGLCSGWAVWSAAADWSWGCFSSCL